MKEPRGFRLSESWRVSLSGSRALLFNLVTGAKLQLSGHGARRFASRLRALPPGSSLEMVASALPAFTQSEQRAFAERLLSLGILIPCDPDAQVRARGFETYVRSVRDLSQGQRLPRLFCARSPNHPPHRLREREVAVAPVRAGWVALSGTRPCLRCLELRLFPELLKKPRRLSATLRRATLVELLAALSDQRLGNGQALVVLGGRAASRGVLLVHPDCEHCHPGRRSGRMAFRDWSAFWRQGPRPLHKRAARSMVDPLLGPLGLVEEKGKRGELPLDVPFVWGGLRLARCLGGHTFDLSSPSGTYGKGRTAQECRLLALSEGVERLACLSVRPDGGRKVGPGRRPFVHGVDLVANRPALVPLESVAVGLPPRLLPPGARPEPFYSGAASHRTLKEAVVHATLELVERDAFMVTWYRKRSLRPVEWPRKPSALASARRRYLERRGMRLELFDMTLDLPLPTLLLRMTASATQGNWPRGGAMLFASCSFGGMRALERLLGLACGQFLSLGRDRAPEKNPLDERAVRALGQTHPAWPLLVRYLNPARSRAHSFLGQGSPVRFESLPRREPRSAEAAFRLLRELLSERHLSWFAVRLTDENAFAAGFEVAKVVMPDLLRLTPARSLVDFTSPRLTRAWPDATTDTPFREPHPLY